MAHSNGDYAMRRVTKRKVIGYIFRPWITRKDGTRDWAKNHGKRAWKIAIYAK